MSPVQGDNVRYGINDNSSSTTWDSKSESDGQTLRRILMRGSRLNRLHGNYYKPLEDSKLLDKYLKTRALYDALRSQLLSSSLSVSNKSYFMSNESPIDNKNTLEEAKNSNRTIALVNFMNKGAVFGKRKISDDCSCCSCSEDQLQVKKKTSNHGLANASPSGSIDLRSSIVSKEKTYEADNINSCACIEDIMKFLSKKLLEKIRSDQPNIERDRILKASKNPKFMSIKKENLKKSFHTLKRTKAHPTPFMQDVGENGNITSISSSHLGDGSAIKTIYSDELLKIDEEKIKNTNKANSFITDRDTFHKPGDSVMKGKITEKSELPIYNRGATSFNDTVDGKRQNQNANLRQKLLESSKINQSGKAKSFISDRDTFQRHRDSVMKGKITEKSELPVYYRGASSFNDTVDGKRQNQNTNLKQRLPQSTTINQSDKENNKLNRISSASSIRDQKKIEIDHFIDDSEQERFPSETHKEHINLTQPHINEDITKELHGPTNMDDSNEIQNVKGSVIPIVQPTKEIPFESTMNSSDVAKELESQHIFRKTSGTLPFVHKKRSGIFKSISTNSIEESLPVNNKYSNKQQALIKKWSYNPYNKIKKKNLKTKPSTLLQKKYSKISAPMRFLPRDSPLRVKRVVQKEPRTPDKILKKQTRLYCRHSNLRLRAGNEAPIRYKKDPESKQRQMETNMQPGNHALKKCLCNLKIKIKNTKSGLYKNITKEDSNVKDISGWLISKKNISTVKNNIKASNSNFNEPKSKSKCECFDDVVTIQSKLKKGTKRETFNEIHTQPAQDIDLKTKFSMGQFLCKCIDNNNGKEVEGSKKKPDEFGHTGKSYNTKSLVHASKCECLNSTIRIAKEGKSNDETAKSISINVFKKTKENAETCDDLARASKCDCFDRISNEKKQKSNEAHTSKCVCFDPTIRIEKKGKSKERRERSICISVFKKTNDKIEIDDDLAKCEYFDSAEKSKSKRGRSTFNKTKEIVSIQGDLGFKCECDESTIGGGIKRKSKDKHDKITFKDAPNETLEKKKICKLRNRSVQTVNPKRKQEVMFDASHVSTLGDTKTTCFKELFSKDHSNKRLTIGETNVIHEYMSGDNTKNQSQLSSSTRKTNYSTKNHGLRRCFCTLKLGKYEKKRNNIRNRLNTAITMVQVRNLSRSSERARAYECNCGPKKSDSQDLNIILAKKRREEKGRMSKKPIKAHKTKSHSSLTSRSVQLTRPVKLHSVLVTHKSEVLPSSKTRHLKSSITRKFLKNKCSSMNNKTKIETFKPCLCTLKLSKRRKYKKKRSGIVDLSSCDCSENIKKRNNTCRNFGTVTQKTKMKSKSSDTQRETSKVLFVKSDNKHRKPSLSREIYSGESLKQSVKIGSNFSFSVEFYKNLSPEINLDQNKVKDINVNFFHNKQQGPMNRYSHNQKLTLGTKMVTPEPSRCMCTLNISKKDKERRSNKLPSPFVTKKPIQVYTVSTITVAETQIKAPKILSMKDGIYCFDSYCPSKHNQKWQNFKESLLNSSISTVESKYIMQGSSNSTNPSKFKFASHETIHFNSDICCNINYLKNIGSKKQRVIISTQSQNKTATLKHNGQKSETESANVAKEMMYSSQLTGVQALLNRRYYTMNILVSGQKKSKKRKTQKLRDFECEPGVCIPYECDPYECHKLIMKRLGKNVSKMSGTDKKTKTTTATGTSTKKRKVQSTISREQNKKATKAKPAGVTYQTLPRTPRSQRRVVRVGSAFSFDIEFSKSGSTPAPTTEIKHEDKRTGVIGNKQHREAQSTPKPRHDSKSQSIQQVRHKTSSVTPMLKRCFCTLKLQKKGKQQKEKMVRSVHHGTSTPPKLTKTVEKKVLKTTGSNTKTKQKYPELLPYECEPGICVPGECDPYACLEIIKRRNTKDSGTDCTRTAKNKSASTMCTCKKEKKRQVQTKTAKVKSAKTKPVKTTPIITKPVKSKNTVCGESSREDMPGSRQVVKIGSSFSFNIEFYKDGTPAVDKPAPKEIAKIPKHVDAHKKVQDDFSQHEKPQGTTRDAGTGTRQPQSKVMLKRCFCTLKLSGKKDQRDNVGHERATPVKKKHVAKTQTKKRSPPKRALLPYECEPGICIPGECDPYACLELIKKRSAKEKTTSTPEKKTKTKSLGSSKTSKTGKTRTQTKADKAPKNFEKCICKVQEQHRSPECPERQVVRIGSSFSFNVEFYKDHHPACNEIQPAAPKVKRAVDHRCYGTNYEKKTIHRGLGDVHSTHDRESQMDKIQSRNVSINPILKRCFCTLQLQKLNQSKSSKHKQTKTRQQKEIATLQSRSVMTPNKLNTLPYQLEPYECEPGVCEPGECDPHECIKHIKKRLMNTAGTHTKENETKTKANMTHRKPRDGKSQSAKQREKPVKPAKTKEFQQKERKPERPLKKAVKLGSSFSFDVEFFKHSSDSLSTVPLKTYATSERLRTTSKFTEERLRHSKSRKAQHSKEVRDMKSQARKGPTENTGVGPFFKRCFCTLQYNVHKSQQKPFGASKTDKARASICSKKQCPYRLEPYECEPGVCIPGECDPYECLKLIKKRMNSQQCGTEPQKCRSKCVGGTKTKKTKPTKTQAKSVAPSECVCPCPSPKEIEESEDVCCCSPRRQAVRIGSNFSFNIEFYRERSPKLPSAREVCKIIKREIKATETSPKTCSTSCSYKKVHHRDCPTQSECLKTVCEGTNAPLKRCFCTLKLFKMGTQQTYHKAKIEPTARCIGTKANIKKKIEPVACDTGTKTKYDLEPYECEPGVCVPGECDPYECLKRIRLRNKKNFGTDTTSTSTRSTETPKEIRKKVCTETICRVKRPCRPCTPCLPDKKCNRHSVRLGSNFSFNVEFNRESSCPGGSYDKEVAIYKPCRSRVCKVCSSTSSETKTKTQSTCRRDCLRDSTCQGGVCRESKGSAAKPLLKRCFCTLTLQRAEVNTRLNPQNPKHSNKKSASNKNNYLPPNPSHELDSDECKPGICVLGECDPHECQETSKKRGLRRVSRTGPRKERSFICKRTELKGENYSPENVDRFVEEPRFPFLHGNARRGVKINSKFSINVEFYKEMLPPITNNTLKNNCPHKENCREQDECVECNDTEKKSSVVAILKRCFCSPKSNRTQLARTNHPQNLTVGRVEVIRPKLCFGQYWVQYQIKEPTKKSFKTNKKVDTIMSYTPRKYTRNKRCHLAHQCHLCHINGPLKNEVSKLEQNKVHKSAFKKMFYRCKSLFTKRSSQRDKNKNYEVEKHLNTTSARKNVTNQKPGNDILKFSKSERHPNKSPIEDIKKSKSLKVAKLCGKDDYKKKYCRFQSGDAGQGIKFVKKRCLHCQARIKPTIPMRKEVRFATILNGTTVKSDDTMATEENKDSKHISCLFKSPRFKCSGDCEYLKLCSCCGGMKRKTLLAGQGLELKNKMVIPEKVVLYQETRRKHKQSCPYCICRKNKSLLKPKTTLGKKGSTNVCENMISKKEIEKLKKLEKEAKHHEEQYIAKSTIKKREIKEKYLLKKLASHKNTTFSSSLAESVLNISKLNIIRAGGISHTLRRAVVDPEHRKFQSFLQDLVRSWKNVLQATKNRFGVKSIKRGKGNPETHSMTKFMHSPDGDFKKRFYRKHKSLWRRPNPDCKSTPCVISLGKRPWISVYLKCGWFYPHWLSIARLWKQFLDVTLFVWAAVVLSPCIFTIELCRSLRWCCFGSG